MEELVPQEEISELFQRVGALQERQELSQRWVSDGWEHTVTRTAYLIHASSLCSKASRKDPADGLGKALDLGSPQCGNTEHMSSFSLFTITCLFNWLTDDQWISLAC